jgi:hypothetical protein
MDQHIQDNERITTDEIGSEMSIGHGTKWCKNNITLEAFHSGAIKKLVDC